MKRKPIKKEESNKLPRARKRFGQNFLVDHNCCAKIVELANISENDTVLEIGPGRGAITKLLAEKGCQVFALEIDRDLKAHLNEQFKAIRNVKIIEGDALNFDFSSLLPSSSRPLKVVANLPYNVATPILFKLLESRIIIEKMVLMFQKEVAARITSLPGNKSFGILSIFPQLYSDISVGLTLPPGAFKPAPKVDSQVLIFELLSQSRFKVENEDLLKQIVKTAFSQRRKKLSNTLKSLFPDVEAGKKIFNLANIDSSRRAETLSIEEFCRLSNLMSCEK